MPINYFDTVFSKIAYDQSIPYVFHRFRYDKIPNDCDSIGITFWDGEFNEHMELINTLLPKTKKLLIFAPEPVWPDEFVNFVTTIESDSRVTVIGNAVLNFKTPLNYITFPNWFITLENYYVSTQWGKKLLDQLVFDRPKSKKFDCLLGSVRPHRIFIDNCYQSSTCQNDIIFTFFKNNIADGIWNFDLNGSVCTADETMIAGEKGRISSIIPVDIYNDSYYSIVAETTVSNNYSHFTEKTAKPIVAKRPFVIFAGQYFLRNLRSLGFQTFGAVIDESYDDIQDNTTRFAAAWNEVERLCQLDPQDVMQKLQSVLKHNQQHFLQTDWVRRCFFLNYKQNLDAALI